MQGGRALGAGAAACTSCYRPKSKAVPAKAGQGEGQGEDSVPECPTSTTAGLTTLGHEMAGRESGTTQLLYRAIEKPWDGTEVVLKAPA